VFLAVGGVSAFTADADTSALTVTEKAFVSTVGKGRHALIVAEVVCARTVNAGEFVWSATHRTSALAVHYMLCRTGTQTESASVPAAVHIPNVALSLMPADRK